MRIQFPTDLVRLIEYTWTKWGSYIPGLPLFVYYVQKGSDERRSIPPHYDWGYSVPRSRTVDVVRQLVLGIV